MSGPYTQTDISQNVFERVFETHVPDEELVWPSAYASGALVQCRKKGAKNWGNKSKKKKK